MRALFHVIKYKHAHAQAYTIECFFLSLYSFIYYYYYLVFLSFFRAAPVAYGGSRLGV